MNQTNTSAKAYAKRSKLIFGLLYTMQAFVNKMTPAPLTEQENEPITCLNTPTYRLHVCLTLSGFRVVLTTSLQITSAQEHLKTIYRLFVDYVISTPYYTQGETLDVIPILFDRRVRSHLESIG